VESAGNNPGTRTFLTDQLTVVLNKDGDVVTIY